MSKSGIGFAPSLECRGAPPSRRRAKSPLYVVLVLSFGTALLAASESALAARYLDPTFSSVIVEQNIVYGQAFDEYDTQATIDLKLDRYTPSGDSATDRPVIIWAHAGGYTSGDKANDSVMMSDWAKRGFVTASINYRLCKIPSLCAIPVNSNATRNAKYDMQMAVRYVRDNAVAWGIDPNRIVAAGHSAGGGMTFDVTYDPEHVDPNYSGSTSSAVSAGINKGQGVTDEAKLHLATTGEPPTAIFVGGNDYQNVGACSTTNGSGYPAAQMLYEHLRSRGISAELSFYPLANHALNPCGQTIGHFNDYIERSSEFLYRRLPLATITSSTPQAFISRTDIRFATNVNGNPDPPPKTITIANIGGGTLNWSVSSVPSGVVVTPTSGSGLQRGESSTISIEVHPTACVFPYCIPDQTVDAGDIIINTTGAAVTTHAVAVYAHPTNTPVIQLRETITEFDTNTSGLPAPPAQTVTVENVGGGTLTWSATDSLSWISEINQTGTSLGPGQVGSFQISTTPASDTTCRFSGVEKVCGPYTVSVSAASATTKGTDVGIQYADRSRIATSAPEMYHFLPANGQTGTTSQFFTLKNMWGGTLAWQATQSGCSSTSIIPSSGSLASNATQTVEVRLTWNPGTVVGAYAGCFVTISDNGSSPAAVWPSETITVWGVATD